MRPHLTDDPGCWCGPTAYRLCPECDGDDILGPAGAELPCWRCSDQAPWPGLLLASEYEMIDDETTCLLVHPDVDGGLPPEEYIRGVVRQMQQDLEEAD